MGVDLQYVSCLSPYVKFTNLCTFSTVRFLVTWEAVEHEGPWVNPWYPWYLWYNLLPTYHFRQVESMTPNTSNTSENFSQCFQNTDWQHLFLCIKTSGLDTPVALGHLLGHWKWWDSISAHWKKRVLLGWMGRGAEVILKRKEAFGLAATINLLRRPCRQYGPFWKHIPLFTHSLAHCFGLAIYLPRSYAWRISTTRKSPSNNFYRTHFWICGGWLQGRSAILTVSSASRYSIIYTHR